MKKVMCVLCLSVVLGAAPAFADDISMTATDGAGKSSFNSGLNWPETAAPSAGNDYFVQSGMRLRTPANNGSYTFAGDSLTIQTGASKPSDLLGFLFKGTDTTGAAKITVGNLIMDGGMVVALNASNTAFNLYGNINIISDSAIWAKQGQINVYSTITGSGSITNPGADAGGNTLRFHSSANTWTGSLINNGVFSMGTTGGRLNFVIGDSGVNNSLSGTGKAYLTGVFAFDLSNAATAIGSSWTIASIATQDFQATFSVLDFTDLGNNIWQKQANGATYQFEEATGVLSVVPEPATLVLLGLGGLMFRKRK